MHPVERGDHDRVRRPHPPPEQRHLRRRMPIGCRMHEWARRAVREERIRSPRWARPGALAALRGAPSAAPQDRLHLRHLHDKRRVWRLRAVRLRSGERKEHLRPARFVRERRRVRPRQAMHLRSERGRQPLHPRQLQDPGRLRRWRRMRDVTRGNVLPHAPRHLRDRQGLHRAPPRELRDLRLRSRGSAPQVRRAPAPAPGLSLAFAPTTGPSQDPKQTSRFCVPGAWRVRSATLSAVGVVNLERGARTGRLPGAARRVPAEQRAAWPRREASLRA